jgi:hypothetical protein
MSEDEKGKIDLGFRDVQGIIALGVVGGAFTLAGVAIFKGADVMSVLNSVLPLASMVVGFFFGVKSQQ